MKLRGTFDWGKLPRPQPLKSVPAGICKDVKFNGKSVVLYMHHLALKPGVSVAVSAGGKPMLVTARVGKGRVAAVLALPFGVAPQGKKGYWECKYWTEAMAKTLKWLMGR